MGRDIIIGVSSEIARKGAMDMVKEICDLADKYNIPYDIAYDIYIKGAEAYEKILNEYLKTQKQKE